MVLFNRRQFGQQGERVAVELLRSEGLSIIEVNFHCPIGEIDIIAEENDTIVFVEVKTRSSHNYGLPQEAVDYYKQKKLVKVATYYLQKEHLENKLCRFDVISIIMRNNKIEKADHFIDAFIA